MDIGIYVTFSDFYFIQFSATTTPQVIPVVLLELPPLYLDAGFYTEYRIPEGTFYDYQDGPTRSLSLQLLSATGQVSAN